MIWDRHTVIIKRERAGAAQGSSRVFNDWELVIHK